MNTFIIIGVVVLIVGLIYLLHFVQNFRRPNWEDDVRKRLKGISQRYDDSDIDTMKALVIEADALLDYCFKQLNLKGETMGHRLRAGESLFSRKEYNDIWKAHKLRNKLVHEIDHPVNEVHVEKSYRTLTTAIKHLIS